MQVIVTSDYEQMSKIAAEMIGDIVGMKPRAVLGLATGSTPLGTYQELVRLHREDGIDFSQIVSFNLDEYIGLPHDDPQSYHYFMQENFFNHINMADANIHIPDGMADDFSQYCHEYEDDMMDHGGLDIQLLGIGSNGHIAFNEPGSSLGSRTRIITLTEQTRQDNARFFKSLDEVPKYAITMGIGTILDAAGIILLASGESKADAVAMAVEGPITASVPASAIQLHPNVSVIVDRAAGSKLKREYPDKPREIEI